jgi:hypothetical protein
LEQKTTKAFTLSWMFFSMELELVSALKPEGGDDDDEDSDE